MTLGSGAATLDILFQIGSYRKIIFDFGTTNVSTWSFEFSIKNNKGSRSNVTTGTITSVSGTSISVELSGSSSTIEEGDYYYELRRTDLDVPLINGTASFTYDARQGSTDSQQLSIDVTGQTVNVTAQNSASSTAAVSWGSITGTLSSQTDLQTALNAKQATGLSWLLASGGTLTGANTIVGSSTNITKWQFPSLGTTQTDGAGHWLQNPTAAAAGSQQISPSTVWEGQGWKTTATAASQSVKFKADVVPVQGTTNPTGQWRLSSSINGAAYVDRLVYNSSGNYWDFRGDGTLGAVFRMERNDNGVYWEYGVSGNTLYVDSIGFALPWEVRQNGITYVSLSATQIFTLNCVLGMNDAKNVTFGTTTGTKIGTATSQKFAFWNATPIVQPTTAVTAAIRVGGGGAAVTDTDTFDGYTIAKVVAALRSTGLLA